MTNITRPRELGSRFFATQPTPLAVPAFAPLEVESPHQILRTKYMYIFPLFLALIRASTSLFLYFGVECVSGLCPSPGLSIIRTVTAMNLGQRATGGGSSHYSRCVIFSVRGS